MAFKARDIVTAVKTECNVVTGYEELGLILGIIMFLYLHGREHNGIMGLDVCWSVVCKLGRLESINGKWEVLLNGGIANVNELL